MRRITSDRRWGIAVAYAVRTAIAIRAQNRARGFEDVDPNTLAGSAREASFVLWTAWRRIGVGGHFVVGAFRHPMRRVRVPHAWCELTLTGRHTVDVTARQFGDLRFVSVVDAGDTRLVAHERDYRAIVHLRRLGWSCDRFVSLERVADDVVDRVLGDGLARLLRRPA